MADLVEGLKERLGPAFLAARGDRGRGVPSVRVAAGSWHDAAAFAKDRGHVYLNVLTSVDLSELPPWLRVGPQAPPARFEVILHLTNLETNEEIRLATPLREDEPVASVVDLFPGANYPEREVYDLMGIAFEGHPDLKRILLAPDWEGHPLRKDYPVEGYDLWNPFGRS